MTRRRLLPEGFFGPVDYAARTPYRRPPGFYRRLQSIAPFFRRLGITPAYVVELEVPGRRTGQPRRTLALVPHGLSLITASRPHSGHVVAARVG